MAVGKPKPEHMTHLDHKTMVRKDHPRIAFRGYIDAMEAEILICQYQAVLAGYTQLVMDLQEALDFVRGLIRCDVLGEKVGELRLCGYSAAELRECSHHPEEHFGQPHFMAAVTDGAAILYVNRLRTLVRQSELAAYKAFKDYEGQVTRVDIMQAMNRLSSLMWIMMIKLKAGKYEHNL